MSLLIIQGVAVGMVALERRHISTWLVRLYTASCTALLFGNIAFWLGATGVRNYAFLMTIALVVGFMLSLFYVKS